MGDKLEMPTETIEERFGMVAERKGYITSAQLVKALEIQVIENIRDGEHRFVGEILLDQGLITRFQINDVLESMKTGWPKKNALHHVHPKEISPQGQRSGL